MTPPYIASTGIAHDAADLIARFGDSASLEATLRATRSRNVGNHLHFCRWREAGRLIDDLAAGEATGIRH